jgi:hypothetical protein
VSPALGAVALDGALWSAVVEGRAGDRYRVHLLGWSSRPGPYFRANEVDRNSICLPGEGPAVLVERDGAWLPARVTGRDGANVRVRYLGRDGEGCVPPERLKYPFAGRPLPPAPLVPDPAGEAPPKGPVVILVPPHEPDGPPAEGPSRERDHHVHHREAERGLDQGPPPPTEAPAPGPGPGTRRSVAGWVLAALVGGVLLLLPLLVLVLLRLAGGRSGGVRRSCAGCGAELRLPAGAAGKRFRCPLCGASQRPPRKD